MPNPVQTIALTSRRIAKLAALRTFLFSLIPAATALIIAFSLDTIAENTWEMLGYVLTADRELALQIALVLAAGSIVAASAIQAVFVYRREHDFMAAAAEIDQRIRGHEEIVTLAALSDPAHIQEARAQRSPLFPLLWRRAIAYFEGFDPRFEFRLDWRRPLAKSTIFSAAGVVLLLIATLGLVQPPTPAMAEAQKLRKIAREIERTESSPAQLALAAKIREAARALENPKLPPEQKMAKLDDVKREMGQQQAQKGQGNGGSQAGGTGNQPDKNATGTSKGEGEGKGQGQGAGKSEGAGTDKNAKGGEQEKSGAGSGSGEKKESKAQSTSVKLQNELKNAEAQVQAEGAKNPNPESSGQAGADKNKGAGESAGNKPGEKGAGKEPNPNMAGNIPMPGAKGGQKPGGNEANGPQQQGGSNQGDTHLGEMPAPVKYQRFLKPGEKGEALDIHDARYVMFRLPSETAQAGGGRTVPDTGRPKATTPYANVPLAPTRDDAPPDERQLVPPRYRELIK